MKPISHQACALTLVCAVLAGCATIATVPSTVSAGREIAGRECASCHAIAMVGSSSHPQAPPLRDLYKRYPVEGLRRAFTQGIEVAHPMPKFRLKQAEIDQLLVYLKSLDPCAKPSSDEVAMKRCFEPLWLGPVPGGSSAERIRDIP